MSQEMGGGDREGIVKGFEDLGDERMASSVERWGSSRT